jgi:hypothetical protein
MADFFAPTGSPTVAAIDAYHEAKNDPWPAIRLSGGTIGKPCERELWFTFRWVDAPERHSGRMLRLFETGHREEARLIADLRNAGVAVFDRDPETQKQYSETALDGHFVAKPDGICTGIVEAPVARHALEIKTHSSKSFAQLTKHGVAVAKPEHVAQMQACMGLLGLERAFYLAKNKDTDELYAERIHFDAAHFAALMAKAERIIRADDPPARISDNPEAFACRFCKHKPVCHEAAPPLRNCRTCLHSSPAPEAGWHCNRHAIPLEKGMQETGCPYHLYLPGLVPGEQIDADEMAETVTYRMADGSTWTDGEGRTIEELNAMFNQEKPA